MPIYMQIAGIEGDSTSEQFKGWFEAMSFSWGANQTASATGGGGGAGKVQFQDFHFTKMSGKGSPLLMLACASGKHLPAVQLVATKPRGEREEVYLKITLSDVLVSSYHQAGDSASVPLDDVSLNFAKIRYEQALVRPNGATTFQSAEWDVKANKGG